MSSETPTYEVEEGEFEFEEGEFEQTEESKEESEVEQEQETENVQPEISTRFGTKTFKELGVSPWLINNLDAVGIKQPTLI